MRPGWIPREARCPYLIEMAEEEGFEPPSELPR